MSENKYVNQATTRIGKRKLKSKFRTRRTLAVIIAISLVIAFALKNKTIIIFFTCPFITGWIIGESLNL